MARQDVNPVLEELALFKERPIESRDVVRTEAAPKDESLCPLNGPRGIDLNLAKVAQDVSERARSRGCEQLRCDGETARVV